LSKLIKALAALNGAAVFAIGLARFGKPAGFWVERSAWILIALGVTAIVPLMQVMISEWGEKSRRSAIERARKIEAFLVASLIHLVRHAGADWENIGVQVFLVRRRLWRRHHVRAAKVRLGAVPSSGTDWTEGKGIIGLCWATRAQQCVDLASHFAPYLGCDKASWDALPDRIRFGLDFEDFTRLGGKYGVVAAVPIMDERDRYVGCVTADNPPSAAGTPNALDNEEVLKALATTAHLVQQVL
jgi:hypothetical protein